MRREEYTSEKYSSPPSRSTRCASARTARLSAARLITQFETITSKEASARPHARRSSILPSTNSVFGAAYPNFVACHAACSRATSICVGVMSTPTTRPVSPTSWESR